MKKTYMMPSMKVREIKPTTILAGSDPTSVSVNSSTESTSQWSKESNGFDDEPVENTFGKVNNTIW